ncbi:aldo/keto reductase [Pseudoroseomonas wenyumeiae]|uniref:Aldo/keto reductase n=1 Tax=Teichococcus wenyumeiae TaxID=2478470 RepID=A0A3A9J7V3_9PROT|nr:aldo/keto reductase [Pseudoroseomonas wenyumeiae]RKK02542.1 aldo/keto reductase [Pseudoroseomonas wenyumeiae]RMI15329.1 aldo/keto reductase [Pseudoroseomonas wenyumeiae]
MNLQSYRPLGRSGLLVSPLALGTMTFGTARWGADEAGSRAIFERYVELGGNFVDTADVYSGGRSEEMVGQFVAERGLRDRMVIATKSGFATGEGFHQGGNGARHIHAAVERSLQRLRTDFIDLYWIHIWDGITPAEELLQTMAALIQAGKIRYWGISNMPAWYAAQLATLAQVRGLPSPIGLQYFYSLVERGVESEHVPLCQALGMALVPWSPLAYGLLTGKYDRAAVEAAAPRQGGVPNQAEDGSRTRPEGDKRLDGDNPFGDTLFTDRNWAIVETLTRVADEVGESPARVALAWVVGRPGVASTLMGVSRVEQVTDNVAALSLNLTPQQLEALDAASGGDQKFLYSLFRPGVRNQVVFGGADVRG